MVAIVDDDSCRLGYDCDMEGAKSITFLEVRFERGETLYISVAKMAGR